MDESERMKEILRRLIEPNDVLMRDLVQKNTDRYIDEFLEGKKAIYFDPNSRILCFIDTRPQTISEWLKTLRSGVDAAEANRFRRFRAPCEKGKGESKRK